MLVKVCGLKDEKNINDVSNLDIDFMGLIFYRKSKRFIDKDFLVKKNNKKYFPDDLGVGLLRCPAG